MGHLFTKETKAENNIAQFEDEEALLLFTELNKKITPRQIERNTENNSLYADEFQEFDMISVNSETEMDILYSSETADLATVIAYNENTNTNILLEATMKREMLSS